jgi:hypothetical protein
MKLSISRSDCPRFGNLIHGINHVVEDTHIAHSHDVIPKPLVPLSQAPGSSSGARIGQFASTPRRDSRASGYGKARGSFLSSSRARYRRPRLLSAVITSVAIGHKLSIAARSVHFVPADYATRPRLRFPRTALLSVAAGLLTSCQTISRLIYPGLFAFARLSRRPHPRRCVCR